MSSQIITERVYTKHVDHVGQIIVSSDGRWWLHSVPGQIWLHDSSGLKYIYLPDEFSVSLHINFSPDNKKLLILGLSGGVMVGQLGQSNPPTLKHLFRVPIGNPYSIGQAYLTSNCQRVVCKVGPPDNCKIQIYNQQELLLEIERSISRFYISPQNNLLAAPSIGPTVNCLYCWDLNTLQELPRLSTNDYISYLSFSADESKMVVITGTTYLQVYETKTHRLLLDKDYELCVLAAAISPDGRWLAVGLDARFVPILDIARQEVIQSLYIGENIIHTNQLNFVLNTPYLYTASGCRLIEQDHYTYPEEMELNLWRVGSPGQKTKSAIKR